VGLGVSNLDSGSIPLTSTISTTISTPFTTSAREPIPPPTWPDEGKGIGPHLPYSTECLGYSSNKKMDI